MNLFGEITGLQINWNKTEMMLFNYTKKEELELTKQKELGIKIKSNIKYLGINITKDLKEMEEKFFLVLRKEVEKKIVEYKKMTMELQIDKIFRINSWVARQKKLPRDVVVYFVRTHLKENILLQHYESKLTVEGAEIQLLKDVPGSILRKRKEYASLTRRLRDMEIRYKWENPEGISFHYKQGRVKLTNVQEAKKFLENLNVETDQTTEDRLEELRKKLQKTKEDQQKEDEDSVEEEEGEGEGEDNLTGEKLNE